MPSQRIAHRGTWTDVEHSAWDTPTKVWAALDPSASACPGVDDPDSTHTYTLIPGPTLHFNFTGSGLLIFGFAWAAAKQPPVFPAMVFSIDGLPAPISWSTSQPQNATCMPFSIAAPALSSGQHRVSVVWEKVDDGVIQESILTQILAAEDASELVTGQAASSASNLSGGVSVPSEPALVSTTAPGVIAAASPQPLNTLLIVAIVVPTALVLLILLVGALFWCKRARAIGQAKNINPFIDPVQSRAVALQPMGETARRIQAMSLATSDLSGSASGSGPSANGTMPYREHLAVSNPDATAMTGKQRAIATIQQWSTPAAQSIESDISHPADGNHHAILDSQPANAERQRTRPDLLQGEPTLPRYER